MPLLPQYLCQQFFEHMQQSLWCLSNHLEQHQLCFFINNRICSRPRRSKEKWASTEKLCIFWWTVLLSEYSVLTSLWLYSNASALIVPGSQKDVSEKYLFPLLNKHKLEFTLEIWDMVCHLPSNIDPSWRFLPNALSFRGPGAAADFPMHSWKTIFHSLLF